MTFMTNDALKSHTLLNVSEFLFVFCAYFHQIWMKFGTGDVHRNLLSD